MTTSHNKLPQMSDQIFLTDGGLETSLIFEKNIHLPEFAAFGLVESTSGQSVLKDYYADYLSIARDAGCGFILESPTWRANPDWGRKLGYDQDALRTANREAIALMQSIRRTESDQGMPVVISGCVGPHGDGYVVSERMTPEQAREYHGEQIGAFAAEEADMVSAITMTHAEEAIGVALASRDAGLPSVISFTTETDGRLPSGMTLADAVDSVDDATGGEPAYYMVNCAHPDHFSEALADGQAWVQRVRGIRANASRMSHAELDESEELDSGNPEELGQLYRRLRSRFPHFSVLGGCCGTDHRHVAQVCAACH